MRRTGRVHLHVIAFRIDIEHRRAISDFAHGAIHERTSRELEIRFDLERGQSILVPDRDFERPERGAKKYEIFRGAESGIDPETVKADARLHGTRRQRRASRRRWKHRAITFWRAATGAILSSSTAPATTTALARRLGVKAKAVRDAWPTSIRPACRVSNRRRRCSASAPIWDRDAATRAADQRIIDVAIRTAPAAPEARQRPEVAAEAERPAQAAQAPSQSTERAEAAAWQPDAAHELAATADAAVDRAAHAGEGLLRGLSKLFSSFINWLADSIAPPPPPTRDQAERMARSAEEKQEARAQHEARDAEHEFILREIERSRQSLDQMPTQPPTAAELYGTPKPRAQERDNQREWDRGLEL